MLNLIKKDLLLQKKPLPFVLVLLPFFAFALSGVGSAGLVISTMALCYMLVYDAGLREEKNDGNKLLICLPIRRSSIVLSKYAAVYLYAAAIIAGNGLIRFAAVRLGLQRYTFPVTPEGALAALAALTVIFSIFYPLIFKYGYLKSRLINMIVLFSVAFAGAGVWSAVSERADTTLRAVGLDATLLPAFAIAALALLAGSYFLSLFFYRKREF